MPIIWLTLLEGLQNTQRQDCWVWSSPTQLLLLNNEKNTNHTGQAVNYAACALEFLTCASLPSDEPGRRDGVRDGRIHHDGK